MEGAFLDPGLYLQEFGHRGMQPCESALPAAAGSPTEAASSPGDVPRAAAVELPAEAENARSAAESPAQASGTAKEGPRTGAALLICPAIGADTDAAALLKAWELCLVDNCPKPSACRCLHLMGPLPA